MKINQKACPEPLEYCPAFQPGSFEIREYRLGDEVAIYQLFHDTVHHVNSKDYTQEQLDAWAPALPDLNLWKNSLSGNYAFVAVATGSNHIIGFADLDENGCLYRGFVHKNHQRQGVGKALLFAREARARQLGMKQLYSDVSITARPFFEKHGYAALNEQTKVIRDVSFINYYMVKKLV